MNFMGVSSLCTRIIEVFHLLTQLVKTTDKAIMKIGDMRPTELSMLLMQYYVMQYYVSIYMYQYIILN